VRGKEHQLETVWNLINAIFDGDASHKWILSACGDVDALQPGAGIILFLRATAEFGVKRHVLDHRMSLTA
jgi:hypothetical protein